MRSGKGEFEKETVAGNRKLPVRALPCPGAARLYSLVVLVIVLLFSHGYGQNKYEKHVIDRVDIQLPGAQKDTALTEQYRLIASGALGASYSTPRVRDAIEALYGTKKIETVTVTAALNA